MGNFKDITGQRFGNLTVIEKAETVKVKYGTVVKWLCKCECGNTRIVPGTELRRGKAKHCGCLKVEDLTGKKFNKLTVIRRVENTKNGQTRWLCECDCGNTKIVTGVGLRRNHVKSCGCLVKEMSGKNLIKHGLSNNKVFYRLMHIRKGMKIRCYNPNNKSYSNYGGRGIKVCDEWLDKKTGMKSFYDWAIQNGYKEGLTIDRIDVNGNYEPNNCRWVTNKIQCNNKTNNHIITYNGETHTMTEWSEIFGISYDAIRYRIKRNFPKELWFYPGKITREVRKEYENGKIK